MENNILKAAERKLTLLGYAINTHVSIKNLQNIITPADIIFSDKGKINEWFIRISTQNGMLNVICRLVCS